MTAKSLGELSSYSVFVCYQRLKDDEVTNCQLECREPCDDLVSLTPSIYIFTVGLDVLGGISEPAEREKAWMYLLLYKRI